MTSGWRSNPANSRNSGNSILTTAPWFWRVADKFHGLYREQLPLEAGLFDFNRYQHQPDGAGY